MTDKKLIIINIVIIIAFITVLSVGLRRSKYTNYQTKEVADLHEHLIMSHSNQLKHSIIRTKSYFSIRNDLDEIDQNLSMIEKENLLEGDRKDEEVEKLGQEDAYRNPHLAEQDVTNKIDQAKDHGMGYFTKPTEEESSRIPNNVQEPTTNDHHTGKKNDTDPNEEPDRPVNNDKGDRNEEANLIDHNHSDEKDDSASDIDHNDYEKDGEVEVSDDEEILDQEDNEFNKDPKEAEAVDQTAGNL